MDEKIIRQLEARFAELPEDVQKAIQSSNLETNIHDVARKYQLHVDQEGILGDEIRLVMLGLVDPADFSKQLSEELKIPAQQAEQIAGDVSAQLFVPIRNSMRTFVEEKVLQQQAAQLNTSPENSSAAKSVVMPSAASATPVPAPAKPVSNPLPVVSATPAVPKITPPAPPASAPASSAPPKPADMHAADMMLREPTITVAPKPAAPQTPVSPSAGSAKSPQAASTNSPQENAGQVKPVPYKVDPYREPPE